jgi:hypothetical protein
MQQLKSGNAATAREEWLNRVARLMGPWFDKANAPLPKNWRVSLSLMGRNKRLGVCYSDKASNDGHFEILIRIDQDDPVEVSAILCHELAHAALGIEEKHGPAFKRLVTELGLEGKATATTPGTKFKAAIKPILAHVGKFPHAALNFKHSSGPKKQGTRMIKAECPECGYTVRVTRKWLEQGLPSCPKGDEMTADIPDDNEDEDSDDDK